MKQQARSHSPSSRENGTGPAVLVHTVPLPPASIRLSESSVAAHAAILALWRQRQGYEQPGLPKTPLQNKSSKLGPSK